jgi:hypothetical protein
MAVPSFVKSFASYASTRTDCPPDFHVHAAMVALAVALGNQVWCDGWGRRLYPNLWAVILAPSGSGKSVPLDLAARILDLAGLGDRILPNAFSQEAIIATIAKRPVGIFVHQEFASFMGALSRDYNAGFMAALTELYDCPERWERELRKERFVIHNPALSMLAASSPDWFSKAFSAEHLRGGFLARFIYCPSSDYGPDVDDPGPYDTAVERGLADHLREVADTRGHMDFGVVADQLATWGAAQRKQMRAAPNDDFAGLRSRVVANARKATMLFAASRHPGDLMALPADAADAIKYVEHSEQLAEDYLGNRVGHDRDDAHCIHILEILRAHHGTLTRSDVLRFSHLSARELTKAQETLVESDRIVVQQRTQSSPTILSLSVKHSPNGGSPIA